MQDMPPDLTIVVPTFNERDNVDEVVARLDRILSATPWEVVFVDDDSPDGTAEHVFELSREDARPRCQARGAPGTLIRMYRGHLLFFGPVCCRDGRGFATR